ncbi:MAG: cell division protein SepF [Actinomycetales bacterium]|nr:cell division protein SepF [Actinomycetales bacterium]
MAGALRKTMVYLGLAENEERYDAFDGYDEVEAEHLLDEEPEDDRRAQVTPIHRGHLSRVVPMEEGRQVHRISTIHPRTYSEAKTIGEAFRAGTPVIMNLGEMDEADAKRLVDFAAGLIFGLHGSIERVTSKVFLLSPADVEVLTPEKSRSTDRGGFFNQS